MKMNVHSQWSDMSVMSLPNRRSAEDARRERIIEAAERAFVRHGFHATTMQHVAEEAEMSAGNLYRYFPSKEALVEGLCALDTEGRAAAFADLFTKADNIARAMEQGLKDHVLSKPREKARMIVEIWAESGRNARVAELTRAMDADVLQSLERLVDAAKAAGVAAPSLNSRFAARFFFTFVAGLFKRIATEPDFDRAAETAMACSVLKALIAGALAPGGEALPQ